MPSAGAPGQMTDVRTLRDRARRHIEEGAVTPGYGANREVVLKLSGLFALDAFAARAM